ncbi:MAG: IMP dehydrogenase [Nanoarchaeota archaeon]
MNINQLDIGLNYKDIVLIPKKGIVDSRDDVDVSCEFFGRKYKLPVCPANMKSVINFDIAEWLSKNNYFYILHRFYDYKNILDWIKQNQDLPLISISLGVKDKDRDLYVKINNNKLRVDIITIDISHGFSEKMEMMIKSLKNMGFKGKIIAGNIWGDKNSVESLTKWGADALKIGLSYGQACVSYQKTRIASPMFSCGLEASQWTNLPLIGDGSIRENGDIVLGICANYDMLMAGSIFAACENSPAEFAQTHISRRKIYYGSASVENKGHNKNIEGKSIYLDCNNMTYKQKLEEIKQDLSSACSFLGGKDLSCIRYADYQVVF